MAPLVLNFLAAGGHTTVVLWERREREATDIQVFGDTRAAAVALLKDSHKTKTWFSKASFPQGLTACSQPCLDHKQVKGEQQHRFKAQKKKLTNREQCCLIADCPSGEATQSQSASHGGPRVIDFPCRKKSHHFCATFQNDSCSPARITSFFSSTEVQRLVTGYFDSGGNIRSRSEYCFEMVQLLWLPIPNPKNGCLVNLKMFWK